MEEIGKQRMHDSSTSSTPSDDKTKKKEKEKARKLKKKQTQKAKKKRARTKKKERRATKKKKRREKKKAQNLKKKEKKARNKTPGGECSSSEDDSETETASDPTSDSEPTSDSDGDSDSGTAAYDKFDKAITVKQAITAKKAEERKNGGTLKRKRPLQQATSLVRDKQPASDDDEELTVPLFKPNSHLVITNKQVKWVKMGGCKLVDDEPRALQVGWKLVINISATKSGKSYTIPQDQIKQVARQRTGNADNDYTEIQDERDRS
jgi:hypothetical protein